MNPKYEIGQKVLVNPVINQQSPRGCDVERYAGQIGEVTDYYWISPRSNEVIYIYTVKVGAGCKEVVLHEDEMETCID